MARKIMDEARRKLAGYLSLNKDEGEISLRDLIFANTIRSTLLTIAAILLVVTSVLLVAMNLLDQNISEVMTQSTTEAIGVSIDRETSHLADRFDDVVVAMKGIQEQIVFFYDQWDNFDPPKNEVTFGVAENGVYYKTADNGGSSLYYSSDTVMNDYTRRKALLTEYLDPSFKSLVDNNALITQIYLNTWDNMNRLYPFMIDAPKQYGPTLTMSDYNFYNLADSEHNPGKEPVWTDSYLDPAGQGWMVSCIVPIYKEGFLEGVAGADVTLDVLIAQLLESPLPIRSTILLANAKGDIIAMNEEGEKVFGLTELKDHQYTSNIKYTVYKPDAYNLAVQPEGSIGNQVYRKLGESIDGMYLEDGGSRYLVFNKPIAGTDWRFLVLSDEKVLNAQYYEVQDLLGKIIWGSVVLITLIIGGSVAASVIQSRRVSHAIAEPIQNLQAATAVLGTSFQKVELDQHKHIKEIQSLVDQYNTMVDELDARTDALIEKEAERLYQEELAKHYEQEAVTDSLTRIFNRRKLDDALDMEIERANRSGEPLSLVLIDIDNFKMVNDGYGHQVGDDVLIEFSQLLLDNTRMTDIVGRWGGEEFLIICPYTKAENAAVLAEKVRLAIAAHGFGPSGNQTASFGVAQYAFEGKKAFFSRVDQAMYEAKHQNKNRVIVHPGEGATC